MSASGDTSRVSTHADLQPTRPKPDAEALDVLDLLNSAPNIVGTLATSTTATPMTTPMTTPTAQVETTPIVFFNSNPGASATRSMSSKSPTSFTDGTPERGNLIVATSPRSSVSGSGTNSVERKSIMGDLHSRRSTVLPPLDPPSSPSLGPTSKILTPGGAKPTDVNQLSKLLSGEANTNPNNSILLTSGATEEDLQKAAEAVKQAYAERLVSQSPSTDSDANLLAASTAAAAEAVAVAAANLPPPVITPTSAVAPQTPSTLLSALTEEAKRSNAIQTREEQGNRAVADLVVQQAQEAERRALIDRATFIELDPKKEMILKLYTCTWNMFGLPPPSRYELEKFITPGIFDIYVIGTEECENSIAMSLIFSSKAKWTTALTDLMGNSYVEIVSETLQAIHCIVFARRELAPMITRIETQTVATGLADILGNKGAVALAMDIGATSFLFVNSHFTSGDSACDRRNADYQKINSRLTLRANAPRVVVTDTLLPTSAAEAAVRGECYGARRNLAHPQTPTHSASVATTSGGHVSAASPVHSTSNDPASEAGDQSHSPLLSVTASGSRRPPQHIYSEGHLRPPHKHQHSGHHHLGGVAEEPEEESKSQSPERGLLHDATTMESNSNPTSDIDATFDATARFDCVIWMGDFNYRVKVSRSLAERLLQTGQREVLLNNDELRCEMAAGRVFNGCVEGPLTFPPTYKYDLDSDTFDTSEKQRIPSWTDRIVWKRNPTKILLERYDSCRTVRTSDHRPVFAYFLIRVTRNTQPR